MNPNLQLLNSYPFEKLNSLISECKVNSELNPISLAIGEPKHSTPKLITAAITNHLHLIEKYPTTRGSDTLRTVCAKWLQNRFDLNAKFSDADENILPVNGTREALFAFAQCVINAQEKPIVLIPNPFYQIYEGAALLAGAEPVYYDCQVIEDDIPSLWELDELTWNRCQLIYICTPGNPTGQIAPEQTLRKLIEYSVIYNFRIASDECYSEIYPCDKPAPAGLLQYAQVYSDDAYENCMAFYSLSKRSSAPGLRSGFVAGGKKLIKQFLQYRTYHGCAMPLPTQSASIAAWSDEAHVQENRKQYDEKFTAVLEILHDQIECNRPDAGFYLWPKLQTDDESFCKLLYSNKNVLGLPGSYLARSVKGYNPGKKRVRLALVATSAECIEAANRIREVLNDN